MCRVQTALGYKNDYNKEIMTLGTKDSLGENEENSMSASHFVFDGWDKVGGYQVLWRDLPKVTV